MQRANPRQDVSPILVPDRRPYLFSSNRGVESYDSRPSRRQWIPPGIDCPMSRATAIFVFILLLGPAAEICAQNRHLDQIVLAIERVAVRTIGDVDFASPTCIRTIEAANDWLVRDAFTNAATKLGTTIADCIPPFENEILVVITDIRVQLQEIDDELYSRTVAVSLSMSIPYRDDHGLSKRVSRTETEDITDTIAGPDVDSYESSELPFTKPIVTRNAGGGFWSDVAEPIVVVGTTIAMIVVLFTTRGN